ncbi:hypothetical protein SADUNF_Sadunf08G0076300 [Salix dunnii]|uniref:Uncharacterized protein n=1 Tax=Salix dunnii TaxID=1413687 RepID=A0A835MXJ8_9ROSI|nr:hypothetical protein SADUNF_Sadunf08G0076300 [Salix dunnii]
MEGGIGVNGNEREEEQDGMSVHSPCKAPTSSASSLPKVSVAIVTARGMGFHVLSFLCDDIMMLFDGSFEDVSSFAIITSDSSFAGKTSVQEICSLVSRLLREVLFCMHRHFVLYGLMEFLRRSFDRQFSPDEVLQLLDRFYNIEMLKPDDEEAEILNHEEDFSLPQSYFVKEE